MLEIVPRVEPDRSDDFSGFNLERTIKMFMLTTMPARAAVAIEKKKPGTASSGSG
jgi:hypothetical protein